MFLWWIFSAICDDVRLLEGTFPHEVLVCPLYVTLSLLSFVIQHLCWCIPPRRIGFQQLFCKLLKWAVLGQSPPGRSPSGHYPPGQYPVIVNVIVNSQCNKEILANPNTLSITVWGHERSPWAHRAGALIHRACGICSGGMSLPGQYPPRTIPIRTFPAQSVSTTIDYIDPVVFVNTLLALWWEQDIWMMNQYNQENTCSKINRVPIISIKSGKGLPIYCDLRIEIVKDILLIAYRNICVYITVIQQDCFISKPAGCAVEVQI